MNESTLLIAVLAAVASFLGFDHFRRKRVEKLQRQARAQDRLRARVRARTEERRGKARETLNEWNDFKGKLSVVPDSNNNNNNTSGNDDAS